MPAQEEKPLNLVVFRISVAFGEYNMKADIFLLSSVGRALGC